MMLRAFDIPEDQAELARWLERHLVGVHLAELAAELSAVHGRSPGGPPVQAVLGSRLGVVLSGGLGVLPAGVLQQFLRRPELLLDLQELVLIAGGPYWDRLADGLTDLAGPVERGRGRLTEHWTVPAPAARRDVLPVRGRVAWYLRPAVGFAAAAVLLLAVLGYEHFRPSAPAPPAGAWAWNRPGALPSGLPADRYLSLLADEAEEWFRQRPDQPVALARRIAEFREGCSVLILSGHESLAAEDRRWLVERCRAWADKLDKHLVALEAGADVLQVRTEADETVQSLIEALRKRAKEAGRA